MTTAPILRNLMSMDVEVMIWCSLGDLLELATVMGVR
jgi:hypothetical protein